MNDIKLLKHCLKKTLYQRECQKYRNSTQNTKMTFLRRMQKIPDIIINFININKSCDNLLFKKQAKSALIK